MIDSEYLANQAPSYQRRGSNIKEILQGLELISDRGNNFIISCCCSFPRFFRKKKYILLQNHYPKQSNKYLLNETLNALLHSVMLQIILDGPEKNPDARGEV